jgi:biopolymer transport protein ExbD
MRIRQRPPKKARIEIIPMIDVIFFLLVFFMVSSLAMTKINSVPVALPKTEASPEALKQSVILSVSKNGDIHVNKVLVSLDSLGEALAHAMASDPQDTVVVNADEGVDYGLVVRAMDRARRVGVRKFALATEAAAK